MIIEKESCEPFQRTNFQIVHLNLKFIRKEEPVSKNRPVNCNIKTRH